MSFEQLDIKTNIVWYSNTILPSPNLTINYPINLNFTLPGVHDFAYVYLDETYQVLFFVI